MTDRSRIRKDLVIVSTFVGLRDTNGRAGRRVSGIERRSRESISSHLVSKEVNLIESFMIDMIESISLIPAYQINVKEAFSIGDVYDPGSR